MTQTGIKPAMYQCITSLGSYPSVLATGSYNHRWDPDLHSLHGFLDPLESLSQLLQSSCNATDSLPDRLVFLAAQGNLEGVQAIVNNAPERVDAPSRGKTALQVACHQGHLPIVEFLLSKGANMEVRDAEGDQPIHYAAFG